MLLRLIAICSLTVVYSFAIFMSIVGRRLVGFRSRPGHSRPGHSRRRRIIINGTFHNPNWFFAHIAPLVQSDYGEVILVCDPPVGELPNLTLVHPPGWARKLFTSAGARSIWTLFEGIRHPADVFVGYHIFPSAVTALICSRLTGAKAVYQVTSGPLELEGGGWHAENKLMVALGGPSKLVESLAHSVMREFDLLIVRGTRARDYAVSHGHKNPIEIITGSVETSVPLAKTKDIDVALVGRLTEYKRPDRFIRVIAAIVAGGRHCNAVIVGDGPDREALEQLARSLGVSEHISFLGQRKDVPDIVSRAKVFVLTSRWEGVSIAMLEAMATQAVPVVANVGDLSDFVIPDVTGYLIDEDNIDQYAARIVELLEDDDKRCRMATAARNLVIEHCDRALLSTRWHKIFTDLTAPIEAPNKIH